MKIRQALIDKLDMLEQQISDFSLTLEDIELEKPLTQWQVEIWEYDENDVDEPGDPIPPSEGQLFLYVDGLNEEALRIQVPVETAQRLIRDFGLQQQAGENAYGPLVIKEEPAPPLSKQPDPRLCGNFGYTVDKCHLCGHPHGRMHKSVDYDDVVNMELRAVPAAVAEAIVALLNGDSTQELKP